MQVKVFESTDMASGLRKVRQELGPDALILSTRTIKNGKFGLMGKQVLEITAAIDVDYSEKKNTKRKDKNSHNLAAKAYNNSEVDIQRKNTMVKAQDSTLYSSTDPADDTADLKSFDMNSLQIDTALLQEFNDLKRMVNQLAGEITRLNTGSTNHLENHTNILSDILATKLPISHKTDVIEKILLNQGVNAETAKSISSFANEKFDQSEFQNSSRLYSILHQIIADIIAVHTPDYSSIKGQKRMALVGPTGVGKTTTIAKLAAGFLQKYSPSIALITIDTYRIAAVEQLKVYGQIMNLPVEVVITPEQLTDSLVKFKDKELILIDTAGRSPRDSICIKELNAFFPDTLDIEKHLVLSASTRDNELLQSIHQFSRLDISSTIFTKLDECVSLGTLLNVQIQNESPLSYVTNGQRVPEDIVEADSSYLAQLILPSPGVKPNDE